MGSLSLLPVIVGIRIALGMFRIAEHETKYRQKRTLTSQKSRKRAESTETASKCCPMGVLQRVAALRLRFQPVVGVILEVAV